MSPAHPAHRCHFITQRVSGSHRCLLPVTQGIHSHFKLTEAVPVGCACLYVCTCEPSQTVVMAATEDPRPNLGASEAEVISLNERRNDFEGKTCPECGGAWFKVEAIALDKHWHVTGYMAPVTCFECGIAI